MERVALLLHELVDQSGLASLFRLLLEAASLKLRLCTLQASCLRLGTDTGQLGTTGHLACQIGLAGPQSLRVPLVHDVSHGLAIAHLVLLLQVGCGNASPVSTEGTGHRCSSQSPGLCLLLLLPHHGTSRVSHILDVGRHVVLDALVGRPHARHGGPGTGLHEWLVRTSRRVDGINASRLLWVDLGDKVGCSRAVLLERPLCGFSRLLVYGTVARHHLSWDGDVLRCR